VSNGLQLVVRADADTRIGSGHVMRCLALAQAAQDRGGAVTFAVSACPAVIRERLAAERIEVVTLSASPGSGDDARQTAQLAADHQASWVVIDGYEFDHTYQSAIRNAGHRMLLIDDYGHLRRYAANLLLNQNVSATQALYPDCDAELLLGSEFVLLRRDFRVLGDRQRHVPAIARKVLVTMGGSDPHNTTRVVIEALGVVETADLEIVVIVGGGNPHQESLRQAADVSGLNIRLEHNVNFMPKLMAWADMAVTAAGSTCWELAYMGVPMVTIVMADNQQPIAEVLHYRDIAQNAGWHDELAILDLAATIDALAADDDKRQEMVDVGQELIDGRGAERVIHRLMSGTPEVKRSS